MAVAGIWKNPSLLQWKWQRLWSKGVMATRLALAFGLTCVRLYLNGVNHSLNVVTTLS